MFVEVISYLSIPQNGVEKISVSKDSHTVEVGVRSFCLGFGYLWPDGGLGLPVGLAVVVLEMNPQVFADLRIFHQPPDVVSQIHSELYNHLPMFPLFSFP